MQRNVRQEELLTIMSISAQLMATTICSQMVDPTARFKEIINLVKTIYKEQLKLSG